MNNIDPLESQEVEPKSHSAVTLHIERLVLDGFPYSVHDRGQLQEALQRELTNLVNRHGVGNLIGGGMTPALRAEGIRASAATSPAHVGTMVAHSVFNSLSRK